MNYVEEEPGLMELVKSEAALLVKEEVVEDGRQDIAELQCGPSSSAIVGSTNVFDSVADLGNTLNVKEELGAIDIGPTVLQLMDTQGATNQKDVGVVKQERTISHKNLNPILCGGVKEEIIEDKWGALTGAGLVPPAGSRTPQDSLMEQSGACSALHALHKECLETVCRVQLRRLDIFQCQVCDTVYIDAHTLRQHAQDVHGPGQKRSLDRHVKSPEISTGPQQFATADTDAQRSNKAAQSKQRAQSQSYSCDKCGKTYTSKRYLMEHYRNRHSTESHKCHKCNKQFPSKNYLYNHTRYAHSEQQYDCAVCKKIYKSKVALRTHVRQVHRPRPAVSSPVVYTCDYCHKVYATKYGLVQHIDVVHTKVRYRCSECNKEYRGKHGLQGHIKMVHFKEKHEADTDDQRSNKAEPSELRARSQLYSCDECVKTYTCKVSLLAHYRNVHSTESHECNKCNRKFPSKSYLYSHTIDAHSEQQYECAVCKKICKSKPALYKHVYYAHRPRPAGSHQLHTCTNCGRNFKSKWLCRRHEKRGKCAHPTASNTSAVASTSRQQHNVVIVKEEPADGELDLGPVVFQHMDCNYRPYKLEPQLE